MGNCEQQGIETLKDVVIDDIPPIIQQSDEEDESDNQNDDESPPTIPDVEKTDILMVGLDNAGKTKLLYTLKLGHVEAIIPTIGYNVEMLQYNDKNYEIWDIGGHEAVRVLRRFYAENKSVVIYVVDVSDAERFEEAQKDLHDVMDGTNLNVQLIVLANKMDLVPEFVAEDLAKHLKLESLKQKWAIHACSALNDGNSLYKIFELLDK